MERASPTEEVVVESKTEGTDDLLDSKDHVNVIFIGHVGRSTIIYIRAKIAFTLLAHNIRKTLI